MTRTQMLLIRACKSKEPLVRLKSVYRRFYCSSEDQEIFISQILMPIVDDHLLIPPSELIADLSPISWNAEGWHKRVLIALMNDIRFAEPKDFGPNMIWPRRFRDE